jgi:hypothetical protein
MHDALLPSIMRGRGDLRRFLLLLAADAQVMRRRYDHLMPTPQAEWPPCRKRRPETGFT